jgi:hypothetical protein
MSVLRPPLRPCKRPRDTPRTAAPLSPNLFEKSQITWSLWLRANYGIRSTVSPVCGSISASLLKANAVDGASRPSCQPRHPA